MRPTASLTLCLLVGAAVLAVGNQPPGKTQAVSPDRTAIGAASFKAQMIFTPAETPGQAPMMADTVEFADELNPAIGGAGFDAGLAVPHSRARKVVTKAEPALTISAMRCAPAPPIFPCSPR